MEQPTRRWICFAFDYECTAEKPDDHPLHAECGWWQPLPADRDQGNTNSQHLPVDAELVADHRDRGGCPWIITGDEGTSHCSLAERGSSDLDALVAMPEWQAWVAAEDAMGEAMDDGATPTSFAALAARAHEAAGFFFVAVSRRLAASPATQPTPGIEELAASVKNPWIVHDPVAEDWYAFPTETQAVECAKSIIDGYGGDVWPDEVDEIVVTQVRHIAVERVIARRDDVGEDEWAEITGGSDSHIWSHYHMTPAAASPATPDDER